MQRTDLPLVWRCIMAGALFGLPSICGASPEARYDLLITNGTVYNGDGKPLGNVDIAIREGRIVHIASRLAKTAQARHRIDATGLVVAPGFIDPHTHAENQVYSKAKRARANLAYAFQGVTTVVVGNDGDGISNFVADARPAGTNYAVLSGFGAIRRRVIGDANRIPSQDELNRMQRMVRDDMCAGAFGFSAGLYYAPQSFARTDEVIELARVAASYGGYYDTHLRDEGDFSVGLLAALDEALMIGREARIAVHVSHIKALGPAVWGSSTNMIERIEAARAAGQIVTADQYPWTASGTRVSSALVPRWGLDGGLEALRSRLKDPQLRQRLAQDIAANIARRGGAERLLVTGEAGAPRGFSGQTLAALSGKLNQQPEDVAISILESGDASLASFNMSLVDIAAFARRDWVMTGSDGSDGHPRKFATYPKAFADMVGQGTTSIGAFVRRSSGLVADTIGLRDRGYIASGKLADIVIFDPVAFVPRATYLKPELLTRGVRWLVVNGQIVIANERYAGTLPGQFLRHSPPAGLCETKQDQS